MNTKLMRACAPMLPAPGDTVVLECLDEIERLEKNLAVLREQTALRIDALSKESARRITRPPTPAGWSDTDWIKHLQEQDQPHPMAGLHINKGSMDAAADAYEAEYNEAQEVIDEL